MCSRPIAALTGQLRDLEQVQKAVERAASPPSPVAQRPVTGSGEQTTLTGVVLSTRTLSRSCLLLTIKQLCQHTCILSYFVVSPEPYCNHANRFLGDNHCWTYFRSVSDKFRYNSGTFRFHISRIRCQSVFLTCLLRAHYKHEICRSFLVVPHSNSTTIIPSKFQ